MRRCLTLGLVLLSLLGCAQSLRRAQIGKNEVPASGDKDVLLRAHLNDGTLLLLSSWHLDEAQTRLSGHGQRMDARRRVTETGRHEVALEDVALLEVDELVTAEWPVGLGIVTVLSVAGTLACAANPKACFGSCPTFYVDDRLLAEGFSASFAPALEASDLDHLGGLEPEDGVLRIEMRNEALETHYVRGVEMLAVAHEPGESVAETPSGELWRVSSAGELSGQHADLLDAFDGLEYFSLADSTDLATKEFLPLEFHMDAADSGSFGILIESRQSLMSTYLFYQGIAYLGSHYGRWLASLSGERPTTGAEGMVELLGGIELQLRRDGRWVDVGEIAETGPLASDRKLIPLPSDWDPTREDLRLCMTRGMWRLDAVRLVRRGAPAQLVPLELVQLRNGSQRDAEREALLRDGQRYLVSWPGEGFVLEFEAPDFAGSFFLRSRGYYVEWMRDRWLEEENPMAALAMFRRPQETLRELAPRYKQLESEMESIFWESRYANP